MGLDPLLQEVAYSKYYIALVFLQFSERRNLGESYQEDLFVECDEDV